MKEYIRKLLLDSGAIAVGFAKAGEIVSTVQEDYVKWIGEGGNAGMEYLERHIPLRQHTDNVLPGAKTIISLAFNYFPDSFLPQDKPLISAYAYGEDYHIALRKILRPVVTGLKKRFGGEWRVCIDSAPVSERYWAMKSGIGRRGLNGLIIIDGAGTYSFLVEILTTIPLPPDKASDKFCDKCGKCISHCPGKALKGDGTMDASRCLNYITIEKKGELSPEEAKLISHSQGFLFGCDICLKICPHNKGNKSSNCACFSLSQKMETLTPERILSFDSKDFKTLFKNSPLGYAGFERLQSNSRILLSDKK